VDSFVTFISYEWMIEYKYRYILFKYPIICKKIKGPILQYFTSKGVSYVYIIFRLDLCLTVHHQCR